MKHINLSKFLLIFPYCFAVLFLVLTVVGSINHYTPVPYWDMWDANVLFYTRLLDGDFPAWWTQHVNHRTIFSNVLFFIDHKFFNGHNVFLIVSHYVLMFGIVFWFYLFSKELTDKASNQKLQMVTLAVIFSVIFSWIQYRNITWAFQSQMFAVHLIPLFSFFFLYKSSDPRLGWVRYILLFTLCIIFGVTSAFTMMSGIIVLPLMIVMAVFIKIRPVHILVLLFFAIISLKFYFTGYFEPVGQGDMIATLISNPIGTFKFAFMLLGAPAYYIFPIAKETMAMFFGILIALGFAWFLFKMFKSNSNKPIIICLVFVLLFEAATVFGISSGRLIHGFNQAFESRYMTTTLVIWALFILLLVNALKSFFEKKPSTILILSILPLLLLPSQIKSLDKNVSDRFQMLGAALAVELDVRDKEQTGYIWPWMDSLFEMAGPAHKWDASILGHPVFKGMQESLSKSIRADTSSIIETCTANLTVAQVAVGEDGFFKLTGIQSSLKKGFNMSSRLTIVDKENSRIGYLISENLVPRVGRKPSQNVPFLGYASQRLESGRYKLYHDQGYCNLDV